MGIFWWVVVLLLLQSGVWEKISGVRFSGFMIVGYPQLVLLACPQKMDLLFSVTSSCFPVMPMTMHCNLVNEEGAWLNQTV